MLPASRRILQRKIIRRNAHSGHNTAAKEILSITAIEKPASEPSRAIEPVDGPTPELRFVKIKNVKILQQKWRTGSELEWRDVPVDKE